MKKEGANHWVRGLAMILWAAFALGIAGAADGAERTVSAEAIQSQIRADIEKNSPWPKGKIRVEFVEPVSDVTVPAERVSIKVRSRSSEAYVGQSTFFVGFYDNGKLLREDSVRVRMEVLMDVVVSARALNAGSVIDAGDVKLLSRWHDTMPPNRLSGLKEAVGKKISTSVRPNMEITRNILRDCPLIKRGEPVRIVLDSGQLRVTATGISQEDGLKGEVIRVLNSSSKRVIHARVIDNALVRVDF